MTSYTAIGNGEIDPESPITTSLVTKLRDNPIAIAEGANGAPRTSTRSIHPGGSEADGALTNATTLTGIGLFDFTTFTRSSALSLPFASVIRVNGNLSLSAAITVARPTAAQHRLGALVGTVSGSSGVTDGGGGSASDGGAGGVGAGGAGLDATFSVNSTYRHWAFQRMLLGGIAGGGLLGGGATIFIIHGDADFTGGTITADGNGGANGGGGGGSIVVICTGTLTAGTFDAKGGTGTGAGGGGGGGLVFLVASAFAGSRTLTVTGGGGVNSGNAGFSLETTLTEAQINALITR